MMIFEKGGGMKRMIYKEILKLKQMLEDNDEVSVDFIFSERVNGISAAKIFPIQHGRDGALSRMIIAMERTRICLKLQVRY